MLLNSVILILQEILEAALILSVLLAFSWHHSLSRVWVWPALVTGVAAASLYAGQIETISEWFDYVGLEVVNGAIQWSICLGLLVFACLRGAADAASIRSPITHLLMAGIVTLAIAREGFEILLYGMNFVGDSASWPTVLLGGVIGAGIGASLGALLYYGLVSLPAKKGVQALLILLSLFGGNMAAQGTVLLMQADWLPSGQPLWDTNFILSEHSLLGQLMYALVGYEATPTALQAGAYGLQVGLMALLFNFRTLRNLSRRSTP